MPIKIHILLLNCEVNVIRIVKKQQYSTLTTQPQLLQQLDNEVQAMMATHYSPLDSAWNNQTLLALLIQVKQLTATKKAPMTLSSLDPQ
jgi:hypothetical protein